MHIRKVCTNPGVSVFGTVIVPREDETRVMLSKQEVAALRRALDIIEKVTELASDNDGHGLDELYDNCSEMRCAEAHLSEFIEGAAVSGVPVSRCVLEQA